MAIFKSRTFWVSLVGLLVVLLTYFVPTFHLDTEGMVGQILIIAALVFAVAADPNTDPGKWGRLFASREFWVALVGSCVMILNGFNKVLPLGITPEQIISFALLISTFIIGQAVKLQVRSQQ